MPALVEDATRLGYLINDADEHSTPPTTAYQQYVDPAKRHLAITEVRRNPIPPRCGPTGRSR
jgi:hypothetical protein